MAATLAPTEDQTFDALFGWIAKLFDLPNDTPQIIKGFQNLSATPPGSYIVVSPGIMQGQDFGRKNYVGASARVDVEVHVTYSYQVDCYGPEGPTRASIMADAWRTMWGVDNLIPPVFTPLYADAPEQVNIVNSEGQYEQRIKIRLFGQVNQVVGLPQDFFDELELETLTIADQLP